MTKVKIGDLCADMGPQATQRYQRIGVAFRDGDRISCKIDVLPLQGSAWQGWCNVFPDRAKTLMPPPPEMRDDGIPF